MKQVLIIDDSPYFRGYVNDKLEAEKITVEIALNARDGYSKLLSMLPDIAIYHSSGTFNELIDFLKKKKQNPNTVKVPIVVYGPPISKQEITQLVLFNVIKYFTEPVKVDIFFETLSRFLRINFPFDDTPSILDIHVNDSIIFIEVAQGLNREKIGMLKYRIPELIKHHNLVVPKVVIIMTDLELTFIDGVNLELLIDNILAEPKIRNKNFKILSLSPFTSQFIPGHKEYDEIEVVSNLATVLSSLLKDDDTGSGDVQELISDRLLQSSDDGPASSMEMRMKADSLPPSTKGMPEGDASAHHIPVAVFDADQNQITTLSKAFALINADAKIFADGASFLKEVGGKTYDMLLINMNMPNNTGWQILQFLKSKQFPVPILVYGTVVNANYITQAMNFGARAFLSSPLKPDVVVQKMIEILNARI